MQKSCAENKLCCSQLGEYSTLLLLPIGFGAPLTPMGTSGSRMPERLSKSYHVISHTSNMHKSRYD